MLRNWCVLVFSFLAVAASGFASGQAYPNHPVRIVVPFGPGGPDSAARIVAQQLSAQMGQSFVIDNRPGANGIIGTEAVAKSVPDGYTLLLTTTSFSVNPSIQKKLPYDPLRDFTPVSNVVDQEAMFLFVYPLLPVNSIKELIAFAKQPGAPLSYASIGVGNTTHLAAELFLLRAGIKATHVPYKGGSQAVAAVVAGEVQMMLVAATQSIGQIRAGRVRPLAYTHHTRSSLLPDVPTMAEAGVKGAEFSGGRFGLFAPAGTPLAVVEKLAVEIRSTLGNSQVKERLGALGLRPVGSSPEEFRRLVESEVKYFAELVRETGVQAE